MALRENKICQISIVPRRLVDFIPEIIIIHIS